MAANRLSHGPKPTEQEYQSFAERFVDMVLDPRQPWLINYLLVGGFEMIPTEEEIKSGEFAYRVLTLIRQDWMVEQWLGNALFQRDRRKLVPWIKKRTIKSKLTKDE